MKYPLIHPGRFAAGVIFCLTFIDLSHIFTKHSIRMQTHTQPKEIKPVVRVIIPHEDASIDYVNRRIGNGFPIRNAIAFLQINHPGKDGFLVDHLNLQDIAEDHLRKIIALNLPIGPGTRFKIEVANLLASVERIDYRFESDDLIMMIFVHELK